MAKEVQGLERAPGRSIRTPPLSASKPGDGVVGIKGTVGKVNSDSWDSG